MRSPSQPQVLRSQVQAVARRREDERKLRFRRLLAISVMSALTLGAVFLARAETWVTVNPDGSTTRTETQTRSSAQTLPPADDAAQNADDEGDDAYPQDATNQPASQPTNIYNGNVYNGNVYNMYANANAPSTPGTVTFFSGTVTPVPNYGYGYGSPYAQAGVGYRLGSGITGPFGPTLRVFPTVPTNLYSGYTPVYDQPCAPAPFYSYPPYTTNGTYYSGPIGGGGTIYSSTTTTSSGFGVGLGNGGLNISIGNHRHNHNRSTTVVTTSGR